MTRSITAFVLSLGIFAGPAIAQDAEPATDPRGDPEAVQIAVDSGICGDREVASARFLEDGSVGVQCEEDVVAFVPLAGAPGLVAAAGAVLLGAAAGGGSTPDTQ